MIIFQYRKILYKTNHYKMKESKPHALLNDFRDILEDGKPKETCGRLWTYGGGIMKLCLLPNGVGWFQDHWGTVHTGHVRVIRDGGYARFADENDSRLLILFPEERIGSKFRDFDDLFQRDILFYYGVAALFPLALQKHQHPVVFPQVHS